MLRCHQATLQKDYIKHRTTHDSWTDTYIHRSHKSFYPEDLKPSSPLFNRRTRKLVSHHRYLAIHIASFHQEEAICVLCLWAREEKWVYCKHFVMCSNFYDARWTSRSKNSFSTQPTHTPRSCNILNSPELWSTF